MDDPVNVDSFLVAEFLCLFALMSTDGCLARRHAQVASLSLQFLIRIGPSMQVAPPGMILAGAVWFAFFLG